MKQREQPCQPLVRVSLVGGPPAEQHALLGKVEDSPGKPWLGAKPKLLRWVDQDELLLPGPTEEAAQQVGVLVPAAGRPGEKDLKVIGW